MNNRITTLSQLEALLANDEFYQSILDTAKAGDPEWLTDMIKELDYIKLSGEFYIPEFHGVLQSKGLTSKDFDEDALINELPTYNRDFATKFLEAQSISDNPGMTVLTERQLQNICNAMNTLGMGLTNAEQIEHFTGGDIQTIYEAELDDRTVGFYIIESPTKIITNQQLCRIFDEGNHCASVGSILYEDNYAYVMWSNHGHL